MTFEEISGSCLQKTHLVQTQLYHLPNYGTQWKRSYSQPQTFCYILLFVQMFLSISIYLLLRKKIGCNQWQLFWNYKVPFCLLPYAFVLSNHYVSTPQHVGHLSTCWDTYPLIHTYSQCRKHKKIHGWIPPSMEWYCSSIASQFLSEWAAGGHLGAC